MEPNSPERLRDDWHSGRPLVLAGPTLIKAGLPTPEQVVKATGLEDAICFGTSGSSGNPKLVVHNRASLRASASMVNAHLGAEAGDRWLCALPAFHVGGFCVHVRAEQLAERPADVLGGRWDAERFADAIADCGVAWSSLVPAQVADLVATNRTAPCELRGIVVGGGALRGGVGDQARDLGWPVVQSYGMTETASQVATGRPSEPFSPTAIPVIDGWILDPKKTGLRLRGAPLAAGYFERLENTWKFCSLADEDGWFLTSDLVEVAHDGVGGQTLNWIGRIDSQVKIVGELVSLDRLQTIAESLCSNEPTFPQDFAIIDIESNTRDRKLILAVGDSGAAEQLFEEFNARPEIAGYERLSEVIRLPDPLPRSALGKLRRGRLRELLKG